ncbi:MAG: UDP-N-acetylmuramoyl-tripeptide--D-alanyl-D-alanine ligase [Rikenellaceae bacterium]
MLEKLYKIFTLHRKISTDSRKIEKDSIFFALSGENFNGNRFAQDALDKGAVCAVIDDATYLKDERYILVDNTLTTLQALANYHRNTLNIPVIAISGSNGKTTTKELLGAVLSQKFKVKSTIGNLNNHIGVPLTLLNITPEDEIAIIEMGASHGGEIELLCQIAMPNFGLLTNVGRAHLEGFGGEEGVKKAKGELYDFLEANLGKAFFREDDATISQMIAQRPKLKTLAYTSSEPIPENQLVGSYNKFNVAAAVCVGRYFGISEEQITQAIENYTPTNNRSQRTNTELNSLIIDCYNANPSSMESALENFKTEQGENKIVILGDMFELGEFSSFEHLKILTTLETIGIKKAILVGKNFIEVAGDYKPKNYSLSYYENCEKTKENLNIKDSLILLKGSRATHLEELIKHL